MISATWNWMWEKHDQAKDTFRLFTNPGAGIPEGRDRAEDAGSYDERKKKRSYNTPQLIGLFLGPLLFVLTLIFVNPEGLPPEAKAILASTIWIATWWITEAIPIPATSLLPIILFPMTGGLDVSSTTSAYGNDTIFLFMGGFMIALTMEKWNLHKRIALTIISIIGTNTERIVLGFMVATGFLSMWISNTATAMMMVPIGLAIIYQVSDALKDDPSIDTSKENFGFGKALMLGIAYSASLGGIATLIGTPPNTLLAGAVNEIYGIEITFAQWMLFGVPLAWIFILVAWVYLVKFAYPQKLKHLPGGSEVIRQQKTDLGAASYEEKAVFVVFIAVALAWISRSFILDAFAPDLEVTDAMVGLIAAMILFIVPSKNRKGDHLLDWATAVKLPWGILLLFGGGLAIAAGFTNSGLSEWIGSQLIGLQGVNVLIIVLVVAALVLFLTEITSNTATASMMFPIMASLAVALSIHPYALMVTAAVAASCAFMLPVATPPNAVVFGSGYLRIADMAKAGLALNIFGIFFVGLAVFYFLPLVWGLDLLSIPAEFLE
ncbi:DASS family sodium-coupled anion symporter [Microbacterium sp. APC 3898]|uniref:Sodium-dependent dicarboxylate transporter SdcS n=1 Tax=Planococcus notacanthi TaxID=3035188 RepID=A0ABT7ZKM6_9BACL|nr:MULTISPECIES: DASS family sodium-coupled anion symporter [Terrabacteria group]MDN3427704.1 DASS family sodium-coupled anion symporter [Planococcus sp. APC 4016]MDN3499256.1 DASS family sodium-coupled anion symporter [Microbacterium sp. APC 3898]